MKLDTLKAALCLGVSADTVERWIRQGKVPAHRQGTDWVFHLSQLRDWARANGLPFREHPDQVQITDSIEQVTVVQALRYGGLHHGIEATTVNEVLETLAQVAPIPSADREELSRRLKEREELSSTGIGRGVAVPHPREPLEGLIDRPSITACFMTSPVAFGAIDGRPVSAALLLLSPSVQTHLRLLSRVAFCLGNGQVTSMLTEGHQSSEELLERLDAVEAHIGS
ncbi:MAG: hypothetical protein DRJ65_15415 [Acidobacteria bacterium]|nr:MAG: hypothetical protein DRJ65_15415 [Acidobacteriota bacterium]